MSVQGFNRPGDGGAGLNLPQKINFVSNLNAKNQSASMADSVLTLINKVANLGYVGSKRYAKGSGTTNSTSPYVTTVTGLTFQPSKIIVTIQSGTSTYRILYVSPSIYNSNSSGEINDLLIHIDGSSTGMPSGSTQYAKIWTVTSNSFSFQQDVIQGGFTWEAIE